MSPRKVPFFDYPSLFKAEESDFVEIFKDVGNRGAYILQKDLVEFEQNLAKFIKVKHAIGVADCTNGLIISLLAAGIGKGDEVIVPSHTLIATASAIHFVGATPILVECGADHLIDALSVEKAITSKTKVIMPVHLNGRTANMDSIVALALKHQIHIIEDAAQALGSHFKGRFAGTFGLAGAFSFYPAKSLGCFGDGGAVVTNNDDIAHKLRLLRDHGREDTDVTMWGTNSRLDNLQAAFLNYRLKKYDKMIKRRREIASLYDQGLKEIKDLILPPAPNSDADHFDVFQNYELESGHRDELRKFLAEKGVSAPLQWGGKAVHQFKNLGLNFNLPITTKMTARFFMLPLNLALKTEDVEYVITQVRAFYQMKSLL